MSISGTIPAAASRQAYSDEPSRHIVIGITNAQTCLTLTGRLRALREAGFRVTLISSPGELLTRTAAREGVEAIGIPMHREMSPLSDIVSLFRLWWVLVRLNPDLSEFSTPKAGLLGGIASRLAGVPARVYMLRGIKLETTKGLKKWILLAAERLSAASAQVVLCNSRSMLDEAVGMGIAPAAKMRILGDGSSNGVDVNRFSPGESAVRKQFDLPDNAPVIGFVGRLTADKGIPELVEAFDAVLEVESDAHLLLVGWYDVAEDALGMESRARIACHPRIHCTGFVTDAAPYYRAMDVMVLPTWREGFPNAVLEAAASGVPVITTLCTGSRDSVLPEVTGLLIPPGNPFAIRDAVLKLLGDPNRRQEMGQAARRWICANYSDVRVLRLAVSFYKGLMRQPAALEQPNALNEAEAGD